MLILTLVNYHFAKYYFVLKVQIVLYCENGTILMHSITFLYDLVCQLTHLNTVLVINQLNAQILVL